MTFCGGLFGWASDSRATRLLVLRVGSETAPCREPGRPVLAGAPCEWVAMRVSKQEERRTKTTPEPPPRGHDVAPGRRSLSGARRQCCHRVPRVEDPRWRYFGKQPDAHASFSFSMRRFAAVIRSTPLAGVDCRPVKQGNGSRGAHQATAATALNTVSRPKTAETSHGKKSVAGAAIGSLLFWSSRIFVQETEPNNETPAHVGLQIDPGCGRSRRSRAALATCK